MINPGRMVLALQQNISKAVVGKEEAIEYALIALLCKGHVLIEDVPGVGKTTLASALARSLDCSFRRIQFTPDLMPSDVTGFTMVNFQTGEMEFKEGAVMSQIVLTVDGITHPLPQPFIVLAPQNPGEFVGTYPLPEAQVDRFFLRISIGYPTVEQEMDVLERYSGSVIPMTTIEPICSAQDVLAMQEQVTTVYCSPEIRNYVASLAAATRNDPAFSLGASTRAAIALIRGAQACAMLDDRDFVLPEDVQHMFLPVMAHRMILSPEAKMKGIPAEQFLLTTLQNTTVPVKL